ncbi:4456_t:CDS:1, partial [Paraglomus occultum]
TPEGTQSYREFRKIAIRQYGSIDNYVREVILRRPATKNTIAASVSSSSASQHLPLSSEYIIRKNDFPYALEQGIEHWVIWSLKEMTHDEVEEALRKTFSGKEWVFVINPAHLQSVGSVWHGHIFTRDDDSATS